MKSLHWKYSPPKADLRASGEPVFSISVPLHQEICATQNNKQHLQSRRPHHVIYIVMITLRDRGSQFIG